MSIGYFTMPDLILPNNFYRLHLR